MRHQDEHARRTIRAMERCGQAASERRMVLPAAAAFGELPKPIDRAPGFDELVDQLLSDFAAG